MRIRILLTILCISAFQATLHAQVAATSQSAATAEKVHAIIPKDGVACVTVRLQQIKLDRSMSLIPWEIISAGSMDELGMDAMQIDRFDWIVGPLTGQVGKDGAAMIFTSASKFDLSQLNAETFKPNGKTYDVPRLGPMNRLTLVPISDSQFALGYPKLVPSVLGAAHGDGELLQQMKRFGDAAHVSFVFVLNPVRAMLKDGVETMFPELRADATVLAEKVQVVAARAQLESSPTINVLIEAANESDAQAVEASWNRLVETFSKMQVIQIGRTARSDATRQPMQAYLDRAMKEVVTLLKPTRKGNRLLITLDQRAINLARGFTTMLNLVPTIESMSRGGNPARRPPGCRFLTKIERQKI